MKRKRPRPDKKTRKRITVSIRNHGRIAEIKELVRQQTKVLGDEVNYTDTEVIEYALEKTFLALKPRLIHE